jgi:tetratricopeptide (TPR) repeat protein
MALTRPNLAKLLIPLAVFSALLGALLLMGRSSAPAPAEPGGDLGPPSGDAVVDAQRAVRADPDDAGRYASLGGAYLQRARESGDPSFYSRAGRAFGAALRRDPRELGAVIGAGTLAGLRHDFREQLRRGAEARRLAPDLARPLNVLADAQVELGRYGAAARTLQRLVDAQPGLASYSRASYFRELNGDLPGAVRAMRLAAAAGGGAPENRAYVQALLGDLELQRGRLAAARGAYRASLRSAPGDPRALVGLARADAARGRLRAAASRLERATRILPLTTSLTLLAGVERAAGLDRRARAHLAAVRAERALFRAARTRPDAEAVLFEADFGDPAAARRLARGVWRAAPSVRSADARGWALTRAGRPRAALRWVREALRLGTRDPLLRFHAGMAERAAGRPGAAARDLRMALAGRALLSPQQVTAAREALR